MTSQEYNNSLRKRIAEIASAGKNDDIIWNALSGSHILEPRVSPSDLIAVIHQMEQSLAWYAKQVDRYAMLAAQIRNNQPRNWGPE